MGSKTNRNSSKGGINPQTIPLGIRKNPYTSISVEESIPTEETTAVTVEAETPPSSWGVIPVETSTATAVEVEVANFASAFEGCEVISSHPSLVTSPGGEVGFNPPPTATVIATPISKGGWSFNPASLPYASFQFPPTASLKGEARDNCNCKQDNANYALLACVRKFRGEFLTPNQWEARVKSTFSITKVGNFSGGVKDCLVWFAEKKPLQSGIVWKRDSGNVFGIPA